MKKKFLSACPGRDRNIDEKKLEKKKSKSIIDANNNKMTIVQQPEPKIVQLINNNQIKIKSSSLLQQSIDNEIFTLQVKGKKNYEILKKLNDALELQTAFLTKRLNNESSISLKRKTSTSPTNPLEK